MQLSPCSCSPQNLRRQRSQRLTRPSTRRTCSQKLTMTQPLTMTPPQPQRAPMQPPRGRPLSPLRPAGRRSVRQQSRAAPACQSGRSGRPGAIAINSSRHAYMGARNAWQWGRSCTSKCGRPACWPAGAPAPGHAAGPSAAPARGSLARISMNPCLHYPWSLTP